MCRSWRRQLDQYTLPFAITQGMTKSQLPVTMAGGKIGVTVDTIGPATMSLTATAAYGPNGTGNSATVETPPTVQTQNGFGSYNEQWLTEFYTPADISQVPDGTLVTVQLKDTASGATLNLDPIYREQCRYRRPILVLHITLLLMVWLLHKDLCIQIGSWCCKEEQRIEDGASTQVLQGYVQAMKLDVDPDVVLQKYGVETVLLPNGAPLTRYLDAEPQKCKVSYRDKVAVVLQCQ